MATTTRVQNRYDHRLRELVRSTQDISCAVRGATDSAGIKLVPFDAPADARKMCETDSFQDTKGRAPKNLALFEQGIALTMARSNRLS
jgi:hypothetical protein